MNVLNTNLNALTNFKKISYTRGVIVSKFCTHFPYRPGTNTFGVRQPKMAEDGRGGKF